MAFTPFQRPSSQLSIDRKPLSSAFLDDFETTEESFMESTMMSPATTTEDRRDSFGNNVGPVFSPPSNMWDEFPAASNMPERQFPSSGNPFVEHSNNPFLRQDTTSFAQQNSHWPMFDHSPENRTPIVPATYEAFDGDYQSAPASGFTHGTPFGSMPPTAVRPASVFPPVPTPALSVSPPPGGKDWMGMAEQSHNDSRSLPKRMRGQSPPHYAASFQRGDGGIRKKNARFNIPQERNLANIDILIGNSTNEDEIKELKQQKRLLRNRQAALDSRQRKKQRAEELEEENKTLMNQIASLGDELQKVTIQAETLIDEKNELTAQYQERVQELTWEKENMLTDHTNETSELRKKIQILQERLVEAESSESAQPNSASYEFPMSSEMSGLTVHGLGMEEWGDPFADFVMDSDVPQTTSKPMETSLVLAPKRKEVQEEEDDKSGAPGLLMLLLLCGAWVASKAKTSMPVTIPSMPEEVRSDAAMVFDDLMKDHGVSTFQSTMANAGLGSVASGNSNAKQIAFPMPGSSNNRLDNIHNHLTRTTKSQEAESAFSLNVKQYESLTSPEFVRRGYNTPPEDESNGSPSTQRRNLVDTLKAMREEPKDQATSNVYTRSLLWDRIPQEVVQEFKRMAEQNSRTVKVENDGGGT